MVKYNLSLPYYLKEVMQMFSTIIFLLVMLAVISVKIVNEYDRLVVFTLGQVTRVAGPGIQFIIPIIERAVKVDLRIKTFTLPNQDVITKDNVTIKVEAVCFYYINDPKNSVVKIENSQSAVMQAVQTTLRSVLGQHELDQVLAERDKINTRLQEIIDNQTESYGVKVNSVEIKDVQIPENMQRAMARQAEAERERRAKIVSAQGEMQAAQNLAEAARIIATEPGAMNLRQLQTMVEIATEKNSTIIFPIPIELAALLPAIKERKE